jgi:hypothetical protein
MSLVVAEIVAAVTDIILQISVTIVFLFFLKKTDSAAKDTKTYKLII